MFDRLGLVPVLYVGTDKEEAEKVKVNTKLEKKEMFGRADIKIAMDQQKELDADEGVGP